jgi:hypothetical protein
VDLYEGQRYRGPRTFDPMKDFILSKLFRIVKTVNPGDRPEDKTRLKVATILVMNNFENVT